MSEELETPEAVDPWLDDRFAPLDNRKGTLADSLAELVNANPDLAPEDVVEPEEVVEQPPAPEPPPAPKESPKESPKPEVTEFSDGSSLTVEKTSKGWKATLESNVQGVNAEIFYGRNKDELLQNVAAGKINATKKIRQLNREKKMAEASNPEPAPTQPKTPEGPRALTADDKFEIKNLFASDPAAAFEKFVEKTTGGTWQQLLELVSRGKQANDELTSETIAREFMAAHPEYDPNKENFAAMLSFMAKTYLKQKYTAERHFDILDALYRSGFWTVANLEFALEELLEAGLLDAVEPESDEVDEPEEVEEEETPPPPPPPPAPSPRIANERRRPRAGLGIRASEISSARQPDNEQPPSDEDLNDLSDADLTKLFADVRRAKAQGRR